MHLFNRRHNLDVSGRWFTAAYERVTAPSELHDALGGLLPAPEQVKSLPSVHKIVATVLPALVDLVLFPPSPTSATLPPSPTTTPVTKSHYTHQPSLQPGYPESLYLDHSRLLMLASDASDVTANFMLLSLFRQFVYASPPKDGKRPQLSDSDLAQIRREIAAIGPPRPSGKLVYTRNTEVLSADLQGAANDETPEGQRIPLSVRELGTTEIFATSLQHSPNGRFITVVGDGEYIIYTALACRNKAFGSGSSFIWATDSDTYAVLEGRTKVRVYKSFKEGSRPAMKGAGSWPVEDLHVGPLLGARGSGYVVFWDWESGENVRRIDADAKSVSTPYPSYIQWNFFDVRYRFLGLDLAISLPSLPMTHSTF